jgi:UDP-N-acetylglucosamine acyltransferase
MPQIHPTALVDAGRATCRRCRDRRVYAGRPPCGDRFGHCHRPACGTDRSHTTLGARNRIFQFSSIGEIPQDRKYGGEPTLVTIGDDNVIREFVTIHAGTAQDRGATTIGNANLLLAYVHIAHDCIIGDHTTFSNNAQLAGHVTIGDWVTMGGFTGVHQFCRVGAHAMVAAGAIVLKDVPPFITVAGYPAKPRGPNSEGLRRRGFSSADIAAVRRAYKMLYRDGLRTQGRDDGGDRGCGFDTCVGAAGGVPRRARARS